MAQSSAWRVSDAVAFDALRASSARLTSMLLEIARSDGPTAVDARRELSEIRADSLGVDGFDRRSVDALTARFSSRIRAVEDAS